MGKSKRSKGGRGGGGDGVEGQPDGGSDADSVSSMSTALSDIQLAQVTEHVSSQEFVLDKYIDALYEKRYATLLSQFTNSIKKGSTKEVCLACRAIGLLAITLGAGSSSHEIMDKSHPQLLRALQTWSDAPKMTSALDCLVVVTFLGATDLAETQLSLKAIWDAIHPKSGSNVGIVRKPKPPLLAAAISAWAFLLTTVGSSRRNTDSWKELVKAPSIMFSFICQTVREGEEADVGSETRETNGSKN